MTRSRQLLAVLATLVLLLAACSGDDDETSGTDDDAAGAAGPETESGTTTDDAGSEADSDDAADQAAEDGASDDGLTGTEDLEGADGSFPVTLTTAEGDVTIDGRPERIVSLSPTGTEMLFALGAGDQVVAADSYSNYPPEAPTTELSAFEPSLEGITANEPDLVVLSTPYEDVQAGLADIDVPVLVLPAAAVLDDTFDQIAALGIATGNIDGAAELNGTIQSEVVEIMAQVPGQDDREPVRVYHELDDTFYSASSASFIGNLYTMLGYQNIADEADGDGTGYPQLQVEQIIQADPTLIVITDAYDYGPADVAARPGWETLTAVEEDHVIQVDADVASRWGPRVVDLLRTIVESSAVPAGG